MRVDPTSQVALVAKQINQIWQYHYATQLGVDITKYIFLEDVSRSYVALKNLRNDSHLEIAIVLRNQFNEVENHEAISLDMLCEIAEEVSHFLHILWTTTNGKQITNARLEVLSEIDKFLVARWLRAYASPYDREKAYYNIFKNKNILYLENRYRRYSHWAKSYIKENSLIHANPWKCRSILSGELRHNSRLAKTA
jgi:hypothetical protein